MIAEYQEEVVCLQRLLDIVLQPEIKLMLHIAGLRRIRTNSVLQLRVENSDSGMETDGPASGFNSVKSKRTKMVKGQNSCINTKGKKSTELSLLKSPRQGHATPSCCATHLTYFHHMGSLIKHVQIHTKDKEQLCGVCGKRFQSTESMEDHLNSHCT
ncbi:unnamed protein product [Coregonus sp. 'balchen']|nr:unnamed protein product [Coregonus sp. 'balchen']